MGLRAPEPAPPPYPATRPIRLKANLLVRASDPRPFSPHADLPAPHWVPIDSVNDPDGDTVIFDKRYPDRDDPAVLRSVGPRKGRAMPFDGGHHHSGTCPVRSVTSRVRSLLLTAGTPAGGSCGADSRATAGRA